MNDQKFPWYYEPLFLILLPIVLIILIISSIFVLNFKTENMFLEILIGLEVYIGLMIYFNPLAIPVILSQKSINNLNSNKKINSNYIIKRNMISTIIFSVITFSIYTVVWYYKTYRGLKELNFEIKINNKTMKTSEFEPGLCTLGLFVPILNFYLIYRLFKSIKILYINN